MASSIEITQLLSVLLQVVGGATVLATALKLTRYVRQYYAPNLLTNPAGGILSVKGIEQQVGALVANSGATTKCVVPWAIVTGASEGVGSGFAYELARRGFSVVLIARNKARLDELASNIQSQYKKVSTHVISFDFSTASPTNYQMLFQELERVTSTADETYNFYAALVNNVGITYSEGFAVKKFTSVGIEKDLSLLKVNCEAMMQMSKFIIPKMTAVHRGTIINVSSQGALFTSPYTTTYSATKAFDKVFSESLNAELGGTGVVSVSVTPGKVFSRSSAKVDAPGVPADEMARHTLDQINAFTPYKSLLGGQRKYGPFYTTAGHPQHGIGSDLIPTSLGNLVTPLFLFHLAAKHEEK